MEKIECQSSDPVVYPDFYKDSFFTPEEYKADNAAVLRSLSVAEDFQGLKMYAPAEVGIPEPSLYLAGVFQVFVNCGCQLGTWARFPRDIVLHVLDLDKGIEYQSTDFSEMNVSYDNWTYERYDQMPCDQLVKKYFTLDLYQHVHGLPFGNTTYQIQAKYLGHQLAEPLRIKVQSATT